MLSSGPVINLLIYLHSIILLFIFVMYWYDYRKLRLVKDWTGFYVSYKSWNYYVMNDQYNAKIKRVYLWRPKKLR